MTRINPGIINLDLKGLTCQVSIADRTGTKDKKYLF
jgi:hypothetical protein